MRSSVNHRAQEGISIQFTSTQLLQEPTNQEGFKAHTKHVKERGVRNELTPLKPQIPSKAEHTALGTGQLNQCETAKQSWSPQEEVCSDNRQRLL